MPPRGQTKKAAEQKTTPQAGKRQSKPTPKQKQLAEEEDLDDEDYEEPTPKSQAKKKMPVKAKKPASEEEEEDEELDEEELDEDEEELDEEEEEDEEDEEDEDEEEKLSQPKKTLFIKNLPAHTTEDDIKSLNSDILKVRMDMSQNNSNTKYALVDFADPETASKALEQLKGMKINGADVVMDFIGGRSMITYTKPELSPMHDPLKLYVTGFGQKITREQLVSMFPSASDITFELNPKDNKPLGFAFIHYTDPTEAKKVHDSMQDYMYEGRSLVIMYGKKATEGDDLKRKAGAQAKGSPKTKKAKKDEEDEEDDEEEDEEEDDDEENGEGEDEEDDEEGEEDE